MKSKKHKKHEKEKKKRRKHKDTSSSSSSSSSSETGSEEEEMEWVESSQSEAKKQREDWMQDECFVPTYSKSDSQAKKKKRGKSEEEILREKKILEERELNPYWKDNGVGVPTTKTSSRQLPNHPVGDSGYSWLKKAYQRVQEQAAEEGRSMEEVAVERWGSLKTLESMLRDAEERMMSSGAKGKHSGTSSRTQERYGKEEHSMEKHTRSARYEDQRTSYQRSERKSSPANYEEHHTWSKHGHSSYNKPISSKHHNEFFQHSRSRSSSKERGKGAERDRMSRDSHHSYKFHRGTSDYSETKARYRKPRSRSPEDSISDKKHVKEHKEHGDVRSEDVHRSQKSRAYAWEREGSSETVERSKFSALHDSVSSDSLKSSAKSSQLPAWKKKVAGRNVALESKFVSEEESSQPKTPYHMAFQEKNKTRVSEGEQKFSTEREVVPASSKRSSDLPVETSDSEDDEDGGKKTNPLEEHILNDNELNYLAARALRAEIWGDSQLASRIEQDLEIAKSRKLEFQQSGGHLIDGNPREEVINSVIDRYPLPKVLESHLQRTRHKHGRTVYVGPLRTKYFDDNKMSLHNMFEREKTTTVEDELKMYVDAASSRKGVMDEECDEDASGKTVERINKYPHQEKDMQKAIQAYKHLNFALDRCRFCLDKPGLLKHTIIGKGHEVFLCSPPFRSLTEGHCFIVPVSHVSSTLLLDENEYAEIQAFKRGLMKMFGDQKKGVIFMETSVKHRFYPHAVIECIPIPRDSWDLAPFYFKKAIEESEYEWSHNKKLIDLSKKDVRHSVPKGLPFFSVEFGNGDGFAHVIEDDKNFPKHFGREIVGGMLEIDSHDILREREESMDLVCEKVLKLVNMWWKYKDYFKV